ncbi:hypothetical protein M011DRAFT_470481 [Sporormia fimetaria CBS 119925]|uniref:C2H2-type domain-containing protein n=1 Tax=Sporormia fimetaria CBS 119925 TaxID=1340428 RepID=A0A6A6V3Q5_9PLEO|nr:hypothetical protein M011DRAFT_470481 [Sporormia fimetaria CBS 119925]
MSKRPTRCSCNASFPNSELLDKHLAEIQTQEELLAALIKQCQTHSRVELRPIAQNTSCPHEDCVGRGPFATGQKLRRHFEQHFICDETCVYCSKKFTRLSTFRRHAEESHAKDSPPSGMDRKARYMREACNELGRAAEYELHSLGQGRGLLEGDDGQSRGTKRNWDEACLDREAENMGATRIDGPIVDESQQISAVPSIPTQSATTYLVTPEMMGFEAGPTIDGFSGGSMVFQGAVVGMNDIFDAPLLHQLSHPLHGAAVDQPSLFRASGQT